MTGYLDAGYARSFREHGQALHLPGAQGWLLARPVPGAEGRRDAMGCYPLFCCHDWNRLGEDLDTLRAALVSVVLVTDPLARQDEARLRRDFDYVAPYKPHYVVRTGGRREDFVNRSHARHARKALERVSVEVCERPSDHLHDWLRLYQCLIKRHDINGIQRLSNKALEDQLGLPGAVLFRVSMDGETVGLDLWYQQGEVAHAHIVVMDERAYRHHAAYASKWVVLDYFHGRARWLNLGAGRSADGGDGLAYFKQGFATGTRPTWICGRIHDPAAYARLSGLPEGEAVGGAGFFPAYRAAEAAGD